MSFFFFLVTNFSKLVLLKFQIKLKEPKQNLFANKCRKNLIRSTPKKKIVKNCGTRVVT